MNCLTIKKSPTIAEFAGDCHAVYFFRFLRNSSENKRYEGGIVYLLASRFHPLIKAKVFALLCASSCEAYVHFCKLCIKKVAAHPCRHNSQTIRLGWMLRFTWSTSHIPGRFPDLQIYAYFSFSYSRVVQWNIEVYSLLTVTGSSGILTRFPLQNQRFCT